MTTCCVIVDAPRASPASSTARIAAMSKPRCRQKFASSAATRARGRTGATLVDVDPRALHLPEPSALGEDVGRRRRVDPATGQHQQHERRRGGDQGGEHRDATPDGAARGSRPPSARAGIDALRSSSPSPCVRVPTGTRAVSHADPRRTAPSRGLRPAPVHQPVHHDVPDDDGDGALARTTYGRHDRIRLPDGSNGGSVASVASHRVPSISTCRAGGDASATSAAGR